MFCFFREETFSQSSECGTPPLTSEELDSLSLVYPDCTLESYYELCVRIKIHFLNNSGGESEAPNDAYFFDLVQKINTELEPGKVRLTFDDNCIHREDLDTTILTTGDISALIDSNYAEVDFDPSAINIYFVQEAIGGNSIGSFRFKHLVVQLNEFGLLLHELGHCLGLAHTFNGFGNSSVVAPLNFLCKDTSSMYVDLGLDTTMCHLGADGLCDTGIDPFSLDLDGDSLRDGSKWINIETCTQSQELVPEILDWCNDSITAWDIPVRNFMSYYGSCRSEFTPCQYGRMHERIPTEIPEVVLDCAEDPYAVELFSCTDPDITVSTIEKWEDDVVELCPGQKIIITPSGHLTLDNTILTKYKPEVPNEACPYLFYEYMWYGIEIQGRGETVLDNGNPVTLGGLVLKDSSVLEYSKYGIQGLKGFGIVEINESRLSNNMAGIALRNNWPYAMDSGELENIGGSFTDGPELCGASIFNPYSAVNLLNSKISVGSVDLSAEFPAVTHILVDGGTLTIDSTLITNPNEVVEQDSINAVKNGRGKLRMVNGSTINNFNTGIFKAADVYNNCTPRGLYVRGSNILNTENAIHTTSQFVSLLGNYIEGSVTSEGLSYSKYFANNFFKGIEFGTGSFPGKVRIQSPEVSFNIEENKFNNYSLDFYGPNTLSLASCNTWEAMNEYYAVVAEDIHVDMPDNWGDEDLSSGNRHLDSVEHEPHFLSEDVITNYFNPDLFPQELFIYDLAFASDPANETDCNYNLFPPIQNLNDTSISETILIINAANDRWLFLDSIKSEMEEQIPGSPAPKQKQLREKLTYVNHEMSDIVGFVLVNIDTANEENESLWIDRASPFVIEISEITALLYKRDYYRLDSILSISSDEDAEALLEAVNYLANWEGRGIVFDSLMPEELDTLIHIAAQYYGNYTNVLRNFLNMVYNISIYWPVNEESLLPRTSETKATKIDKHISPFVIYPNPNDGRFSVKFNLDIRDDLFYEVISPLGIVASKGSVQFNGNLNFSSLQPGIYWLRLTSSDGRSTYQCKFVIE